MSRLLLDSSARPPRTAAPRGGAVDSRGGRGGARGGNNNTRVDITTKEASRAKPRH